MRHRARKNPWKVVLGVAAGVLGIYFLLPGPLVISDKQWDCSAKACQVSFVVRNVTPVTICRRFTVQTFTRTHLYKGSKVTTLTGAKTFVMELGPHEQQQVNTFLAGGSSHPGGPSVSMSWCWL